jgi:uncharacterized membrane protein
MPEPLRRETDLTPGIRLVRPPVRRLGRALGRHRRMRAGLTQLVYLCAGVGLGLVVPHVSFGFTVSASDAVQVLAGVAGGLIAFIGVVYSLLFLVVQFGSTTFGHRLNLFQGSPFVWHAFAFFNAAVGFAFTAAFAIGNQTRTSGLVPIVTAILLLAAIALFRELMTHALSAIRLPSILVQLAERGREVIDGVYPDMLGAAPGNRKPDPPTGPYHEVRWPGPASVLQVIDVPGLVSHSTQLGGVVVFSHAVGDVLQEHDVIARVYARDADALAAAVLKSLDFGSERTFDQDPTFAFRVLNDIGLRALSPAINDPSTAVQTIDTAESLLRAIALRELAVGDVSRDGELRVSFVLPTWEDYVTLAVDELTEAAQTKIVRERLQQLFTDLTALVPEERKPPLVARLAAGRHA